MKSMLKSLMSVAVAALALTSCSTDATDEVIAKGELKTLKVNATIEQTRTTLATDHVNLAWSEGDEILLYIGDKLAKANAIKHTIGADDIKADYKEGDVVYANYSLNNVTYSDGAKGAEIYIKGKQTQSKANDFAGENLPMVAKGAINGDKVDLTFHPVGCVLVFNVYGPAANENIKTITLKTAENCYGYKNCDLTAGLTAEAIGYKDLSGSGTGNSITVTLGTPATIGTSKPTETKKGENQVYMVVAPFNYTAATFTVTTDAGNTYTFKTANGIDCSQNTARVVNLNLKNATTGFNPEIIVPTDPIKKSSDEAQFVIKNIVFKNIATTDIKKAEVGIFSDKELTKQENVDWLTIEDNATTLPEALLKGELTCKVFTNSSTARTAYIGIKCANLQAAITVTQLAPGVSADKYFVKVTENLTDWSGKYLIVYEPASKALNGALEKTPMKASGNIFDVTITDKGILSSDETNKALVNISEIKGGYLLQSASGLFLYADSNKAMLLADETSNAAENYPNTISIDDTEKSVKITSKAGPTLRYNLNTNSGPALFRFYKNAGQQPVQLYKLEE